MLLLRRWITAKPAENHSILLSISLKLLTGTLWLYIGYMFVSGTGAVLASSNPYGFETRRIGNSVIHFEKEFEKDIQFYFDELDKARIKNDLLWNKGDIDILSNDPVIHLYLCSNNFRASQLSSVVSPAINLFGNKIVLSKEYIEELNWDIGSVLSHEISHVHAAIRYGWVQNYYGRPIWLDEGIASIQSNFWQHTPEHFKTLLEKDSRVTSISKLNSLVEWNSGFLSGSENYIKQYCYSKMVAADILQKKGLDSVKRYLRGDISVNELLGSDIHEYEMQLLQSSEMKPFGIQLQYPDAAFKIKFFWIMQFVLPLLVVSYLLLWLTRQGFRMCRIFGLLGKNAPAV